MLAWAILSKFKPSRDDNQSKILPSVALDTYLIRGLLMYLDSADLVNMILVCRSWADALVPQIYHMPSVKSIKMFYKFLRTMKSKNKFYHYSKFVKILHLDGSISNDLLIGDLQIMLEAVPFLKEFSLIGFSQGCNMLISLLSLYTPSLSHLKLQGTFLTDTNLELLGSELHGLTNLNLNGSILHLQSLKTILVNSPSLTYINLSCSKGTGIPWGKPIVSSLKILILSNTEISDEGLSWIAASCPDLELLDLDGCLNFGDNAVYAVAHLCQRLKILSMRYCQGITDISFQALSIHSSKSLENLNCTRCMISEKAILLLKKTCKLVKLDISDSH